MNRTSTAALEAVYGHPAVLLDESSLLRDALGPLLARAAGADFAVARFRLEAIDLRADELRGLERCRLLVERLKGVTEGDALPASREEVAARLALLLAFLDSGRVEVRAAGGQSWTPDFSVLHRVRRADGTVVPALGVMGAHYFARPYPVVGPAFTCLTPGANASLLAARFEELWHSGYDVGFVLADRIRRLLAAGREAAGAVGEAARTVGEADPTRVPGHEWVGTSPLLVREKPRSTHPTLPPSEAGPIVVAPAVAARTMLAARFAPTSRMVAGGADPDGEGDAGPSGPAAPRPVLDLAAFQQDAVVRAREALARHRGVVLADEVGLGKTFVALALVEAELARGGRALVVGPAALRKEWLTPMRQLAERYGTALRRGQPGDQLAASAGEDPQLAWVTHGALSRGGGTVTSFRTGLVVVDEAHAFRNPHTRRYRALAEVCRSARVVAITATPLNNRLWDLYFQVRLFAGEGAFRRAGVPDLRQAFEASAAAGSARPIVPVLREVVIRRTRPFLRDHYGAVAIPSLGTLALPRRAPPHPVRYELSPGLPGDTHGLAAVLDDLRLAPYRLAAYGIGKARNEASGELLRMSLLKRLESSGAAFLASVRALARYLDSFQRALTEGRLLRPRERGLVEAEQLVLGAVALDPLPARTDTRRLAEDVRLDAAALGELLRTAREPGADPKLDRLRALLRELDGPCVVFTEFRETARYLARALATSRCGLVHGGGAWIGTCPIGRRELIERFAPRANGARAPRPHERIDVLVATDVLAEGLNLQDARFIVSYDLPWNPVRLMQRIGRVDRLGSPHAEVQPFHFVPESGLEELLGVMRRIRRKLRMIHQALPGDAAVLDSPDADDAQLLRILAGDGGALESAERQECAPYEVEERLRRLWRQQARTAGDPTRPEPEPLPPQTIVDAGTPGPILVAPSGTASSDLPTGSPSLTRARGRNLTPVVAAVAAPEFADERVLLCMDGPAPTWLVWGEPAPPTGWTDHSGPNPGTIGTADAAAVEAADGGRAAPLPQASSEPRDDDVAAATILAAALEEGAAAAVPDPDLIAHAEAAARALLARRGAVPPPPPRGAVAAASRLLLRALSAARHDPDPALCARADLLLARLARGVTAGEEVALRKVLTRPRVGADAVIQALEAALGADPPAEEEPLTTVWRLVAAIHAQPAGGNKRS